MTCSAGGDGARALAGAGRRRRDRAAAATSRPRRRSALDEAYTGTTRTLEIEQSDGTTRRVQVRIPPGIADGARARARALPGGAARRRWQR
jgi:hypothetical protein